MTTLLNSLDFYVLPVLNIDGYVYTWTNVSTQEECWWKSQLLALSLSFDLCVTILFQDRMWRKTRSKNAGSRCIGTDPNRNFDAGWCSKCLLTIAASNHTEVQ